MGFNKTFKSKTVVITGASSGIGKYLAIEFSKLGANVTIFARNKNNLHETESICKSFNKNILSITGDVTKTEDCKSLIEKTVAKFGTIDYLLLNAGLSMWSKFEDVTDLSLFKKIMETNFLGPVYCTHYALSMLKKSRGMIIAISSMQGDIGIPFHTGYAASKHALQGFFKSLVTEINENEIDILIVQPHWIRGTSLRKNAFKSDGSFIGESRKKHSSESITIEKCCTEIINAMAKRKRNLVIPFKLKLLPWLNLINPRIVNYLVRKKLKNISD